MIHYDPTAADLAAAGSIVICVRDPDYSNSYRAYTHAGMLHKIVHVHDVDAGYSDLSDPDEFEEWAESHTLFADALIVNGWREASSYLMDLIASYRERHGHAEA